MSYEMMKALMEASREGPDVQGNANLEELPAPSSMLAAKYLDYPEKIAA
jgi:hypothetical protein